LYPKFLSRVLKFLNRNLLLSLSIKRYSPRCLFNLNLLSVMLMILQLFPLLLLQSLLLFHPLLLQNLLLNLRLLLLRQDGVSTRKVYKTQDNLLQQTSYLSTQPFLGQMQP
jgi:hypothetical protein